MQKIKYYLHVAWRIARHHADTNGTYLTYDKTCITKHTIRYRPALRKGMWRGEFHDEILVPKVKPAKVIFEKVKIKYLSK